MLTYGEYLLTVAGEECAEIQQELAKCIRFGCSNHDPSPGAGSKSHAEKVIEEYYQLNAVMEMLYQKEVLSRPSKEEVQRIKNEKKAKVKKYFRQYENRTTYRPRNHKN